MVSVGDDESLRLWDLEKNTLIWKKHLGKKATAIAYSPNGDFLVLGMADGHIIVMDAKLDKIPETDEYVIPSFDFNMRPKEGKASVIALKYSFQGEFLAISYNNEYRESDFEAKDGNIVASGEPSFVMIYVNRNSSRNFHSKIGNRDPYFKFMKLVLPLSDFQASASLR